VTQTGESQQERIVLFFFYLKREDSVIYLIKWFYKQGINIMEVCFCHEIKQVIVTFFMVVERAQRAATEENA